MEKITIAGELIDPYFVLDVVESDSEKFVTKSFRKKAKMWHPDKITMKDPIEIEKAKKHFKILVESYEYIINRLRHFNREQSQYREQITNPKNDNIPVKSIDNSQELHAFNEEFDRLHVATPNDFGYNADRLKDTKEYEDFNYKPYKLFDSKKFNPEEFNKAFEYQQETYGKSQDLSVYDKTNDGFNPFNGSELNGMANVSSFNGLMIVGDTFGQSGQGYYDSSYSDYKKTFEVPKNPENVLNIPTEFKLKNVEKLSESEAKKQLQLQINSRNIPTQPQRHNKTFKFQEEELLSKQKQEIEDKIKKDKQVIIDYQNMYDKTLIESALNNNLVTSADSLGETVFRRKN